ncbi:hypothetical protein Bca4012_102971 [Brassica carinata]
MIGRADIEGSKSSVAMSGLAATSQLSLCRIPLVRTSSELAVRRRESSKEPFPVRPRPTRGGRSRHVSGSSSPPTVGGLNWDPEPSPRANPFRSYGSILPTSLAYIVPSTRGCSPWRPDAVMSATGRGGFRSSGFQGRGNARTPRGVRCSSSRWTLPPAEPFQEWAGC